MAAKKKIPTQKVIIGGLMYVLLFAGAPEAISGGDSDEKCGGEELWSQKILMDEESEDIRRTPELTTIANLIRIDTEGEKRTADNPRLEFEEKEVTVKDVLIRKVILEDDNDYHLVIQDRQGRHMIAEIIDPACEDAHQSEFIDDYYAVRETMDQYATKFLHYSFNITGVLFRDRPHGQTGKADNNLEIHPILKLTKNHKLNY